MFYVVLQRPMTITVDIRFVLTYFHFNTIRFIENRFIKFVCETYNR